MSNDIRHPIFARLYPKVDDTLAKAGGTKLRVELLDGLRGRLLEIGAGHGANFAHYPAAITEAIAIEPEPRLRAQAEQAAAQAAAPITVRAGRAERLDGLQDGSFDVVVCSLVLCSIKDPQGALREIHRVLRPGGELRFFEHIRGETTGMIRAQKATDIVWPLFAGGCHVSRDTPQTIADAGFMIRQQRRFTFPKKAGANPASPHVLGIAVKRV